MKNYVIKRVILLAFGFFVFFKMIDSYSRLNLCRQQVNQSFSETPKSDSISDLTSADDLTTSDIDQQIEQVRLQILSELAR